MNERIEKLKQQQKDEFAKRLDIYYEKFDEMRKSGSLDINEIERLWGEEIEGANRIIEAATCEATESSVREVKKNAARRAAGK